MPGAANRMAFAALPLAFSLTALPLAAQEETDAVGSAPSATAEIVAAVSDCNAAIGPARLEAKVLLDRGWIVGKKESGELAAGIKNETVTLGKKGGQVLNMVQVVGGLSVHCRTVALLSDNAQFDEVRASLIAELQLQPADKYKGDKSDRNFAKTMRGDDLANLLLGPNNRITLIRMDGVAAPNILIANFPKRAN